MEQLTKLTSFKLIAASIMLSFINTMALAQDSTTSNTVTKSGSTVTTTQTIWYAEPWVWAIGAAVFIIIIIAIVRGSGSSSNTRGTVDKVSVTKEVTREDV